jgi:hypothetical protein
LDFPDKKNLLLAFAQDDGFLEKGCLLNSSLDFGLLERKTIALE